MPAAQSSKTRLFGERFNAAFNRGFTRLLDLYERTSRRAIRRPALTVAVLVSVFLASLAIYPLLGVAFFPRTDAGQFSINLKVPTGTRIEVTEQYVAKVEDLIRKVIGANRFSHGRLQHRNRSRFLRRSTPPTPGEYTATVQVALKSRRISQQLRYMDRVRRQIAESISRSADIFQQRIHGG